MKTFATTMLITLLSVLFFVSCSKKDHEPVVSVTENAAAAEEVTTDNDLLTLDELIGISENFPSDFAAFASEDAFYNYLTSVDNLSPEDRDILLAKLPFQTLEDYLDVAYEGMTSIETDEEFEAYIEKEPITFLSKPRRTASAKSWN